MSLWVATILGIVQGIFMFLPVSSTAHLVLTQHWLIARGDPMPPPESAAMILFDLVVHVGTLVSIAVVFRKSLWRFSANALGGAYRWAAADGLRKPRDVFFRLFLLGMLSVLATAVLGFTLKLTFVQVFANPWMISITLTLTGILLWWTDRLPPRQRRLKDIGPGVATTIGLAQGMALVPGLSRSAMTIVFSLFAGLKRPWAAQYSFFLAIPTILAATLVQAVEVINGDGFGNISLAALATGFVVAALVGIVSLKVVVALLYRAQLKAFSFYVWALAGLVAAGYVELPH